MSFPDEKKGEGVAPAAWPPVDDLEAQKVYDGRNPDADEVVLSQVEEEGLKRGLHQRHISMMALAGECS